MNLRGIRSRDDPEINFIPLIDVLLVILIFLMVTTTYQRVAELQITLPEADAEQMKQRPKEINVGVDAQGRYVIDRTVFTFTTVSALADALKRAAGDAKDPVVIINADANATHQSVIHVMEAARAAGLDPHHVRHADAGQVTSRRRAQHCSARYATAVRAESGASTSVTFADRLVAAWYAPRLTPLTAALTPLVGRCSRPRPHCAARSTAAGCCASQRLPVPVIVVGNITVGGSGKTPLVAALADELAARGWRPGIVSRGYGRTGGGDRADAPRLVAPRRRPGARGRRAGAARAQPAFRWPWRATAPAAARALLAAHPGVRRDPGRRRSAALPARPRRRDRGGRRGARRRQRLAASRRAAARSAVAPRDGRRGRPARDRRRRARARGRARGR